jgi:tetratricopeptide (TPR) repeat protein
MYSRDKTQFRAAHCRGRLSVFVVAAIVGSLGLVLCVLEPLPLRAQTDAGWVGKRVVQRQRDFALRADPSKEAAPQSEDEIHVYLVTKADGSSLWLEAEFGGSKGWALAKDVVPVDKAFDFFAQQMRDHPKDSFPVLMRATIWHNKRELGRALNDYTEAIRIDPHNAALYCNRGYLLGEQGNFDNAIADFTEAIKLDPHDSIAYIHRGHAFAEQHQFEKAIADFSETIKINPHDGYAYRSRGHALLDHGDPQTAVADFAEAIKLDPHDVAAYISRGLAWRVQQETEKALADFTEAIRLAPESRGAYLDRGIVWEEKKHYDKALADYDHAIRISPKDPHSHNARGWLLATCPDAKSRNAAQAVESATKACELSEHKDPMFLDTLAAACAEGGEFDDAVKWQAKAIELARRPEDKQDFQSRLELYQQKKPYHQKSP